AVLLEDETDDSAHGRATPEERGGGGESTPSRPVLVGSFSRGALGSQPPVGSGGTSCPHVQGNGSHFAGLPFSSRIIAFAFSGSTWSDFRNSITFAWRSSGSPFQTSITPAASPAWASIASRSVVNFPWWKYGMPLPTPQSRGVMNDPLPAKNSG